MTPEKMRRIRTALGWTQRRMGGFFGVERRAIGRMELGRQPIPVAVGLILDLMIDRPSVLTYGLEKEAERAKR